MKKLKAAKNLCSRVTQPRLKNNNFSLNKLSLKMAAIFGSFVFGFSGVAYAACTDTTALDGSRTKSCTNETVWDNFDGLKELNIQNTGYFTNAQQKTGLYVNGKTATIGDVTITASGLMNGDAIKFNGQGGRVNITGKLTVVTTVNTADGVNISTTVSNSKLTVGDDAEITTKYGMGLRANLSSSVGTINTAICCSSVMSSNL